MRVLLSLGTLLAALGLCWPAELLPQTILGQIVGGVWGMFLGACVLAVWFVIWLVDIEIVHDDAERRDG